MITQTSETFSEESGEKETVQTSTITMDMDLLPSTSEKVTPRNDGLEDDVVMQVASGITNPNGEESLKINLSSAFKQNFRF